jgi:hypothetical protein
VRCASAEFLGSGPANSTGCPDGAAVGTVKTEVGEGDLGRVTYSSPVYNMVPAPGFAAKLGFRVTAVRVTIDLGLSEADPNRVFASLRNVSQALEFFATEFSIWGYPGDPAHDPYRGACLASVPDEATGELLSSGVCPVEDRGDAFLTNPRACTGPLATSWQTTSWQDPSAPPGAGFALTHDGLGAKRGFSGCGELSFSPGLDARPTTRSAQSPSGLQVTVEVPPDSGLKDPEGRAASDIKAVELTLPRGITINPSQAEGLGTCSEAELARESADSEPGEGCPGAAKIGTVAVETPLLPEEAFSGELFVATPYENPFDSLIALYMTVKSPDLGVGVTLAGKVVPDPETGQLVTTFGDPSSQDPAYRSLPQLPFSSFRARLREGARSPLITPPGCGRFEATAKFTPWAGGAARTETSAFQISSGVGGGPCPSGAPFEPGFEAGTLNNAAGRYSPFAMRITRADGMQDLSKFSAVLPPGVVGKIAAIPWCPEAGIARAKSRTGESGGREELADPSCPAASQVGRTTAGAGVGSQLTYVPGSLYLAGPYNGAPLSVVSITPAVAGPFDAGVVVVRVALDLNPVTGVVEADGAASDPIPHILQGIPLNVRDLRVHTDRPDFTLNATSCEPSNTLATLWGAGTALDPSFETPVGRAARYQAAGCAALGFEPKLAIKLKGGVRRGKFPALRAHYRPQAGQANLSRLALTFPSSAFIEQGHFRTICTRVQFAVGPGHGALCPKGSAYGTARVWTPLLDQPLTGPVYLRSSDNNLPDGVFALSGPPSAAIEIEVVVRIDSVKGRLRATVESAPDAPVSRAIVDMQGGRKGLFVNSRNLCHKPGRNRARANLRGQNGKLSRTRPVVRAVKCAKGKPRKAKRASLSRAHALSDDSGSPR